MLDKGEKERSQHKRKGGKPTRDKGKKNRIEKGERNKKGDFLGVPTVREEKLIHASRATCGY